MKPLVLIGDQAWTSEEWAMHQRQLAKRRKQYRDAKYRSRLRHLNPDPVGFLHELACKGPHMGNSRCIPIPVYSRKA